MHPEMGFYFLKGIHRIRPAALCSASLVLPKPLEGSEGRVDLLASDSRDVRNKRGLLTLSSLLAGAPSLLLSLIT